MHHTCICKGKEVIPCMTPQTSIQQSAINVVETPNVMYSSQQSHGISSKQQLHQFSGKRHSRPDTAIDNEKGKSTAKFLWKHDHPDDIPSCTTVAKRRPEDTSQWLVQSRSYMNTFEENVQGINLLPRTSERTHPQLVESRSQIDTVKELETHKENFRLVKLPYVQKKYP
ncbi:Hypothetical predicted protein [Mytilus galloprovincialis]|uniref:Uncharacterized protein n=1 Tax=Mytilus galloprovincialis TaxID=29158 RepID=A0A8B6CVZ0_MYTGA|nr:Hypothetical predicted protein [Mytilus galloprovincialis]